MEGSENVSALATLRGLIESVSNGDHGSQNQTQNGGISESVAQLIAAALAQVSQSLLAGQVEEGPEGNKAEETASTSGGDHVRLSSEGLGAGGLVEYQTMPAGGGASDVEREVEVAASDRPRPLCIKFPTSVRAKIVTLRKEGRKYKDIARELGVSVSGVQKVWERFLATGMIHDRKPSSYAGRPRKYSQKAAEEPGEGNSVPAVFLTPGPSEECTESCPGLTTPTHAVLVAAGEDGEEMFSEEPMDAPGVTVEVVSSTCAPATSPMTTAADRQAKRKSGPAYRQELLLRLVDGCPLALLRAGDRSSENPHVQNLSSSVHKPLYMEYVLGHPFGKVPSPQPFDPVPDESLVILSDPSNPLGKEVLAAVGYSTKVFFNACCKPSPLFDQQKVLSKLPLSVGPSHLAPAMQTVLQLMLDLCLEPEAALSLVPDGSGPLLFVYNGKGEVVSHGFPPPDKLSDYWSQLYSYASVFQCCENFLSATPPSSPCLLCHPFESFAHSLHIRDLSPAAEPTTLPDSPSELLACHPSTQLAIDDMQREGPAYEHQGAEDIAPSPLLIPPSIVNNATPPESPLTQDERVDGACSPRPDVTDEIQYVAYSASISEQGASGASFMQNQVSMRLRESPRRKRVTKRRSDVEERDGDEKQSKRQKMEVKENWTSKAPTEWEIEEVACFVDSVPYCNLGSVFREHEVNGESLVSMSAEMMVGMMGIKAGPAVRIQRKLAAIKREFDI